MWSAVCVGMSACVCVGGGGGSFKAFLPNSNPSTHTHIHTHTRARVRALSVSPTNFGTDRHRLVLHTPRPPAAHVIGQVFSSEKDLALLAMSLPRVSWMVAVARATLKRCWLP